MIHHPPYRLLAALGNNGRLVPCSLARVDGSWTVKPESVSVSDNRSNPTGQGTMVTTRDRRVSGNTSSPDSCVFVMCSTLRHLASHSIGGHGTSRYGDTKAEVRVGVRDERAGMTLPCIARFGLSNSTCPNSCSSGEKERRTQIGGKREHLRSTCSSEVAERLFAVSVLSHSNQS